eukprot:COSAG03_NODE_13550_length_498_cov_1.624060_1_plen_41_part_10
MFEHWFRFNMQSVEGISIHLHSVCVAIIYTTYPFILYGSIQ